MKGTFQLIGKVFFIVFLFVLLFSFAMFQGSFVSWFLFFGYLPIFLYHIAFLFYPIKKWQVSRSLSRHVSRTGGQITVTVRIRRTIPFPLYYCICEEIVPESLQKVDDYTGRYRYFNQPEKLHIPRNVKRMVFPGFRRDISMQYVMEQVPRGEHQLYALRIRTGDVFGMVIKEHIFDITDQVVVLPNERPVLMGESVNRFEQGSVSSQTMNLKNTNVATGIREYTPGDKFSWIDWKQTAKKNTMITKEFEQEKSTDTIVVLDACYQTGMNELAFETGIEVTMSILASIQKQASQAGFLSIGERTVYFPLNHDPEKQDSIQRHLTKSQPDGNMPFPVKLREEMAQLTAGVNMILVTTHIDASFRDTIQQARQRTRQLVVVFIQATSFISEHDQEIIQQLRIQGVVMNVLTENELAQKTIEVRTA